MDENSRNQIVEQLHQCKYCYKTFRRSCALKQHEETHMEMNNEKLLEHKSAIKLEPTKSENYQDKGANETKNNAHDCS